MNLYGSCGGFVQVFFFCVSGGVGVGCFVGFCVGLCGSMVFLGGLWWFVWFLMDLCGMVDVCLGLQWFVGCCRGLWWVIAVCGCCVEVCCTAGGSWFHLSLYWRSMAVCFSVKCSVPLKYVASAASWL